MKVDMTNQSHTGNMQEPEIWDLLDNESAWKKFSIMSHSDQNQVVSFFDIIGIDCAACTFKIESALEKVKGIKKVIVNSLTEQAEITWDKSETRPSEWLSVIQSIGYDAVPFNKIEKSQKRKSESKKIFWRIMLTLLCMMQVMMYTYPIYITAAGEISDYYLKLLRWAAWLLSVPVLIFATKPFFVSALKAIKARRFSMDITVALGMILAFAVSTQASLSNNGKDIYFDSFVMLVLILLTGRYLESKLKNRSLDYMDKLLMSFPDTVLRINKQGEKKRVLVSELGIHDEIIIQKDAAIPADGKVIQGQTFVNESILTGESAPILKKIGDTVFGGTVNLDKNITVEITSLEHDSKIGEIIQLMNRSAEAKPNIVQMIDKITGYFTLSIVLLALVAAIYWWSSGPEYAIMVAVSVLIITCPCAIVIATPSAMIASTGSLAKNGILVKNPNALEAINAVNTVVFDKTGTLTWDYIAVSECSMNPNADFSKTEIINLLQALTIYSSHPLSKSIYNYFNDERAQSTIELTNVEEHAGAGISAIYEKNATIYTIKLGSNSFVQHAKSNTARVYFSINNHIVSEFNFTEKVREEVALLLEGMKAKGCEMYILSGDSQASVDKIMEQTGIKNGYGDCTPEHKMVFVRELQQQGKKIVMIGDGINDAPVLSIADVSIAFGIDAPISHQYADFIFATKNIFKIDLLIEKSQKTMNIIKQNIFWSFVYNVVCIPIALMGLIPAWLAGLGMAISSLIVIANASRLSLGK